MKRYRVEPSVHTPPASELDTIDSAELREAFDLFLDGRTEPVHIYDRQHQVLCGWEGPTAPAILRDTLAVHAGAFEDLNLCHGCVRVLARPPS